MSFEKDLNISYVDEKLAPPSNRLIFKHCFYSTILYFLIYILLCYNPFFKKYFDADIKMYYGLIFSLYIIFAPIIFLIFKPKSLYSSHSIEIYNYITKIINSLFNKDTFIKKDYKTVMETFLPTYKEKQSLMLIFIKVFFGTLMVKFLCNNISIINYNIFVLKYTILTEITNYDIHTVLSIISRNGNFFYKFALTILFSVDIFFFAIGYLTEMAVLKNKIRTVDTNILGIIFCLMCYPPFNKTTTVFLGWHQDDNSLIMEGQTTTLIWILRFFAIFFLTIYALSSMALGTKASNLTNRGTVSRFPYNIVRHPAYISKNIFWFLTLIPILINNFNAPNFTWRHYIFSTGLIILSYMLWLSVYYFRAITEERHLMQDPEYQEYAKKVKYRFIPFVI